MLAAGLGLFASGLIIILLLLALKYTTPAPWESCKHKRCSPTKHIVAPFPPLKFAITSALTLHSQQTQRTGSRYLVVGGHGMVGSHLVEALLARGETRVTIFDEVESDLFAEERDTGSVRFFRGSLANKDHLFNACMSIDVVFHTSTSTPSTGPGMLLCFVCLFFFFFCNTNKWNHHSKLLVEREASISPYLRPECDSHQSEPS